MVSKKDAEAEEESKSKRRGNNRSGGCGRRSGGTCGGETPRSAKHPVRASGGLRAGRRPRENGLIQRVPARQRLSDLHNRIPRGQKGPQLPNPQFAELLFWRTRLSRGRIPQSCRPR
eukprot:TRINITY_DN4594_c0_g1_i1.p3 TRINITY_DN4594_c0_g1~~TRINITY_DN4594_c0_g1_i1.p3  ORF type:complete len:117 (-),score=14.31 TRINITY_DN4594_c0_g1_i1:1110-1460(-)